MTIQSIKEVKDTYGEYNVKSERQAPASIYTDPRVAPQSGKDSVPPEEADGQLSNAEKQIFINTLLKDYRLTAEQFYMILSQGLKLEKTKFLSADKEMFTSIIRLVEQALETLLETYEGNLTDEQVNEVSSKVGELAETDASYESIIDFLNFSEGNDLLKLIEKETGKKYKSIQEIPDVELEQIIKGFIQKYISKSDKSNIMSNTQFMMQLLSTVAKVSNEDYKKLYRAFLKAAPEADEHMGVLLQIVKRLKNNPKEFRKFLKSGLRDICLQNGLDYNKVKPVLIQLAQIISNGGLDDAETFRKMMDSFNSDNIYKDYGNKVKNGTATEQEKSIFRYLVLLRKNPEDLTDEEKQFLEKYKDEYGNLLNEKLIGIRNGFISLNLIFNPQKIGDYVKDLDETTLNDVFQKLSELKNEYPQFQIDKDAINQITDNKYAKYEALNSAQNNNPSSEASSMASSSDSGGYGGFTNSSVETYQNAMQNLANMRMSLSQTEQSSGNITVEPDKPVVNAFMLLPQQVASDKASFDLSVAKNGFVKTVTNAGKVYNNACSSVKDAVNFYINNMLKNDKKKTDFLNMCKNTELTNHTVREQHLYENEDLIRKKLQTSVGNKEVLLSMNDENKNERKDISV